MCASARRLSAALSGDRADDAKAAKPQSHVKPIPRKNRMPFTLHEQIAFVCHEANRAYCESISDFSIKPWDAAQEWQRESSRKGVLFALEALRAGREPSLAAQHESWMREKVATGWKYGPIKDAEKKEHPCIVPYDELNGLQKIKDSIFIGIVKAFFAEFREEIELSAIKAA